MSPKQNRKGAKPQQSDGHRSDGDASSEQLVDRLDGLIAELSGLSYEEDADRFDDIVSELVNYGDLIRDRLIACADSLSYQERRAAVEALGRLGYPERETIIIRRLADANWKVRHSAAIAVSDGPFSGAMKSLLALIDDSHRELRLAVIHALGQLGLVEAAGQLEKTLHDPDWRMRQDSATALGKIQARRSFRPLLRALADDDEDVRNAVVQAIKGLLDKLTDTAVREQVVALDDAERRAILAHLEKDSFAKPLGRILAELRSCISSAVDVTELSAFGRVMTAEDQIDTLDRAFERTAEVDNLHKILLKEGNSSVILVGEAGIGKTAIIHELARRVSAEGQYTVLETSTPELMVGTKYIGEWETKLRDLVEKIKRPRRVFLYLTNVNDLPGAGTTSSSKQNFVTLLAPYMRRGDITVIGESTSEALRTGIEKDLSIKRLFQNIKIDEPDRSMTLRVIRKQLDAMGQQSRVSLSAPAEVLDLLLDLSGTYYSTMAQPGRAVTVLRQVVDHVLEERGDDAEAIQLSAEDVIRGLARFTGLPELLLNDKLPLDTTEVEAFFEKRVLGQPEAVRAIVDLITLIKAGLNDPSKPFGVFLFVGPTGVGKTEIAKALAEFIFGSPERLLRFDLSEYKEYESFEKLIGGTWRNREEGQLTSKVREQPFSVILLDEIEKAHPNIFDLFLQVFDDGRLTDARGRTADFRHTIIVMTSNIASAFSAGQLGFGEDGVGGMASAKGVMREVQRFFRPEFLNRIDRTVVFQTLAS
ncbi:MAG: AAA family ATPase, partial [Myxococcota bacterium]